jgi:hypothetical protein
MSAYATDGTLSAAVAVAAISRRLTDGATDNGGDVAYPKSRGGSHVHLVEDAGALRTFD